MKRFVITLSALALVACGSEEAGPQYRPGEDPESLARNKAAYEALAAELRKVEYPACENVWDGDRPSECGAEVFSRALSECRSRASADFKGSPALIDEYTGDSWQMRAGSIAVQNDEQRVEQLRRTDAPFMEFYSYALGDGTSDIENITCSIDENLRLTHYS